MNDNIIMRYKKILILPILCMLFLLASPPYIYPDTKKVSGSVYYIPVDDEINFGLAGFIKRGLDEAMENNAQLIILGIDTLGGRVDACLDIVQSIESVKDIPICAYIEDKAWSAGALIALACEKIVMRKGSSIGSAAPVSGKGEELSEKYISALRAKFQAVAERNGYPANIAKAMVDKDIEVREVKISGKKEYLTQQQIEDLNEKKRKVTIGEMVSKKDKLLNLSYKSAKKYGIASNIVDDAGSIPSLYGMSGADVVNVRRNWAEYLAGFFTSALISSLLITFGFMLMYVEFGHPGFGLPGLMGLICFGLFFFGRYIVHLAGGADILLFAIGILLIALEIFVIPGFGLAGIGGIALILISLYLALSPYNIPKYPWDFHTLRKTLLIILGSFTFSIVGGLVMLNNIQKIPFLKRLVLIDEGRERKDQISSPEFKSIKTGLKGLALTDLHPVGRARFGKKVLDSVSRDGYIKKGGKIEIIEISGNRILVKKRG